ncbi:MAG: hypothetical protein ABUL72_06250, partial [Armatimonadota bacterium]
MRIVVLPFNAAEATRPALARQFAQFASEIARNASGQEVEAISYMAQYEDEGVLRVALVNPSEGLNDGTVVESFLGQSDFKDAVDGLLRETEQGGGNITVRYFADANPEPKVVHDYPYLPGGVFSAIRSMIVDMTEYVGGKLDPKLDDDQELFGTTHQDAFLKFLEGYDTAQYIEKANGNVTRDFSPQESMDHLIEACAIDRDWEAPMLALLSLNRLCLQYRVGSAEMIFASYNRLLEMFPEEA